MKRLAPALVALALFACVTPAFAAESTPAAPAAVAKSAEPQLVDVQLWPQDVPSGMTLVVVAMLPNDAQVPATVEIPLPQGARVTWAGEIFEQQSQDVQRQPVVSADGRSVAITTVRSRVVQYEAQYKPYVDKGGRRTATLEWLQSKPAKTTHFAFRLPTSSDDVKSEPAYAGTPDANGSGDKLYTIGDKKLAVGQTFTLKVDYTPGKVGALPPVEAAKPDVVLPVLLVLLGAVVAVLVALVLRQRRTASHESDPDADAPGDSHEPGPDADAPGDSHDWWK